jgi:hypothetical protein
MLGAAGGERDQVYVRLPNDTTRGIPAWMFDEAICAFIRPAEKPLIACQALLELSRLLDAVKPVVRSAAHEDPTASAHNTHFPGAKPASSDVGTTGVKRSHSERIPDQVPAPLAGAAALGRAQQKAAKRRLA